MKILFRAVVQELSCVQPCDPMDCSTPGSPVHGILQARILKWVAISFSRGSSWTRDRNCISRIGRQILYHWTSREAQLFREVSTKLRVLFSPGFKFQILIRLLRQNIKETLDICLWWFRDDCVFRDDFQLRYVSLDSSACLCKTEHDPPGGEKKTTANQSLALVNHLNSDHGRGRERFWTITRKTRIMLTVEGRRGCFR